MYDTNGRLVRHPLGTLVRDITYDDADRIDRFTHYVAATAAPAPAYDQVFGYDELNRLTNVTASSTNWGYGYDANGNRISSSAGITVRAYTVSSTSNRLDALSNPVRSMSYDEAGNTLSDFGTTATTHNLEGRLANASRGQTVAEFAYDAMGRRIGRKYRFTINSPYEIKLYAYDQAHHLLGEYNADGTLITEYVWFGDTPVAVIKPDAAAPGGIQIYAIHTDHLDTPRVILDAQGNVRWRWMGEPFGASAAEEQPTAGLAALQQNLRFPGQQYESFGGRHYNHFRDYDPTTGRYVQSDPIGLNGGINTYAYVGGNPLSWVDPGGLSRLTIQYSNGNSTVVDNPNGAMLINIVNSAADGSIMQFQLSGHGDRFRQCISAGSSCSDTLTPNLNIESNGSSIGSIKDALAKKMNDAGKIRLEGCSNASGDSNIVKSISELLQRTPVTGGVGPQIGGENHWLWGNTSGSIGFKRTYINGVRQ